METFVAVVEEMLGSIAVKYNLREKGLDPEDVPAIVRQAFAAVLRRRRRPRRRPRHPARVIISQPTDTLHAAPPSLDERGRARLGGAAPPRPSARTSSSRRRWPGVGARDEPRPRLHPLARRAPAHLSRGRARETRRRHPGDPGARRPACARCCRRSVVRRPRARLPRRSRRRPPRAPPVQGAFEGLLRQAVRGAAADLSGRGVSVELSVPPETALPRCPPQDLERALVHLIQGISAACPPQTAVSVRCERKPVVFKGKDGDVRRDFLMLSLAQAGALTAEEQDRLLSGDPAVDGRRRRPGARHGRFRALRAAARRRSGDAGLPARGLTRSGERAPALRPRRRPRPADRRGLRARAAGPRGPAGRGQLPAGRAGDRGGASLRDLPGGPSRGHPRARVRRSSWCRSCAAGRQPVLGPALVAGAPRNAHGLDRGGGAPARASRATDSRPRRWPARGHPRRVGAARCRRSRSRGSVS